MSLPGECGNGERLRKKDMIKGQGSNGKHGYVYKRDQ